MTTTTVRAALGREVDVRALLRRDVPRILYVAAWAMAAIGLAILVWYLRLYAMTDFDAHAYWAGARGTALYSTGPMTVGAYLYSPAFAQLIRPFALLPWPAFLGALWVANTSALLWLLRPLGWRWVVPLCLALSPEVLGGNIFVPLAAMVVLGFRYPGAWAFSALTKVAPTVMPVWWLVRREWRPLAVWAATTAAVVLVSATLAPGLWVQWVTLLSQWATESGRTLGSSRMVPLIYRAPVGLVLLAVGARKGWRWTVPVAALLCTPVFWLGSYAWLAAIPRLRASRSPQSRSPA